MTGRLNLVLVQLTVTIAALTMGDASASSKKAGSSTDEGRRYSLGILQLVEHPSLDKVRQGALHYLEERGLKDRISIEYLNAQGNMVTIAQSARNLLGKSPDAILAIGTPAAQAVINKNTRIPVIFSPVTDPIRAKLVKSWKKPGGVATGTSDKSPVLRQMRLIKTISPQVHKVAILYNPGEANSDAILPLFKAACRSLDLIPEEAPVQSTSMVSSVASTVKADAIYIPTDSTVVSAVEAVIKIGIKRKIPVYSAESESVQKGALASLAIDYFNLGKESGKMIATILEKKAWPSEMPVRIPEEFRMHINLESGKAIGAAFPEEIRRNAVHHPTPPGGSTP